VTNAPPKNPSTSGDPVEDSSTASPGQTASPEQTIAEALAVTKARLKLARQNPPPQEFHDFVKDLEEHGKSEKFGDLIEFVSRYQWTYTDEVFALLEKMSPTQETQNALSSFGRTAYHLGGLEKINEFVDQLSPEMRPYLASGAVKEGTHESLLHALTIRDMHISPDDYKKHWVEDEYLIGWSSAPNSTDKTLEAIKTYWGEDAGRPLAVFYSTWVSASPIEAGNHLLANVDSQPSQESIRRLRSQWLRNDKAGYQKWLQSLSKSDQARMEGL